MGVAIWSSRWHGVFSLRSVVVAVAALAGVFFITSARANVVATIDGCYDCGVFDTPSLIFQNTSGGLLTNAQMVLSGYQGANNGQTATVALGTLASGSTQIYWGSLPGAAAGTTPFNLTAYDYDDEFNQGTGSPFWLGGSNPNCGGTCAAGGGPYWYAQTDNFKVTFTATISGGVYDGQAVYSVFSPNSNATGGFVGWEGLDPNGYSESPLYDVHTGVVTGDMANIELGTPPSGVPELGTWAMMLLGFGLVGVRLGRRSAIGAA